MRLEGAIKEHHSRNPRKEARGKGWKGTRRKVGGLGQKGRRARLVGAIMEHPVEEITGPRRSGERQREMMETPTKIATVGDRRRKEAMKGVKGIENNLAEKGAIGLGGNLQEGGKGFVPCQAPTSGLIQQRLEA